MSFVQICRAVTCANIRFSSHVFCVSCWSQLHPSIRSKLAQCTGEVRRLAFARAIDQLHDLRGMQNARTSAAS